MNKRYTFKVNKKLNIALYILLAVLLAGIIGNIVMISIRLTSLEPVTIITNAVSLAFTVIGFALTLSLKIALYYKLTDKGFSLIFLARVIKVKYDDILFIRHSTAERITLMYYKNYTKNGEEEITYLSLCIDPKLLDDFFATVKGYNSNVVYEEFDNLKTEMENDANDIEK